MQAGIEQELVNQNERLLQFNDTHGRIENTLSRTKGKVDYFKKSFLRDKVAMTLVILIILAAGGAIAILVLPGNN